MDGKKTLEAFKNLVNKNIDLYTHGVLVQYGLTDEQALEIVSNLTGISKESLVEAKKQREEAFLSSMRGFVSNNPKDEGKEGPFSAIASVLN
ncbi:MAG: hypothetical protein IKF36_06430 [Bacilli bacterium]|nr:hypothetical protein [Bacilli bacterium]